MQALVQRVNWAEVRVDDRVVSRIEKGLLVLLGVEKRDTQEDASWMANKLLKFRIFDDGQGKMNLCAAELNLPLLCVSQFTLCAATNHGNRPSFDEAMEPTQAKSLFDGCVAHLREHVRVETGVFKAYMKVSLENDGPVTFIIRTKE